jgi:competence protein ComEA
MCLSLSVLALGLALAGPAAAQSAKEEKPAKPAVMVNLNTASVAELEALPGIGVRVAERIVEYRKQKGAFKKIEELMNVQGIGEKSFLKLRPQLTVGGKPDAAQE